MRWAPRMLQKKKRDSLVSNYSPTVTQNSRHWKRTFQSSKRKWFWNENSESSPRCWSPVCTFCPTHGPWEMTPGCTAGHKRTGAAGSARGPRTRRTGSPPASQEERISVKNEKNSKQWRMYSGSNRHLEYGQIRKDKAWKHKQIPLTKSPKTAVARWRRKLRGNKLIWAVGRIYNRKPTLSWQ